MPHGGGDYEIRIKGRLSDSLLAAFEGLTATVEPVETVLYGPVPDQSSLHSLLDRIQPPGPGAGRDPAAPRSSRTADGRARATAVTTHGSVREAEPSDAEADPRAPTRVQPYSSPLGWEMPPTGPVSRLPDGRGCLVILTLGSAGRWITAAS
jgi:hypothetical protein